MIWRLYDTFKCILQAYCLTKNVPRYIQPHLHTKPRVFAGETWGYKKHKPVITWSLTGVT